MRSPPALVHPMENSSSARRPTKFPYTSSITVPKSVAIGVIAALVVLLLLLIIVPVVICHFADCSLIGSPSSAQDTSSTTAKTVLPEAHYSGRLSQRLPKSLVPLEYKVDLKCYIPSKFVSFDSRANFTFDGNVSIEMQCNESTNVVVLHIKKLIIDKTSLRLFEMDQGSQKPIGINLKDVVENEEYEQLQIPLTVFMKVGLLYRLDITYKGELSSELQGFYRSSYEENSETKWLAVTQFQPTFARKALPCFDEPGFKAVFTVTLTHPSNMAAISNTMETKKADIGEGWVTTFFKPSPKMSSYLLAFMISEFEYKSSQTKRGITFRIWARPTQVNHTKLAVEMGPKILDLFEEYFSLPFPLAKQDMVAIPDFDAGAMENWGLITYRETLLLFEKETSSSAARQKMMEVMAHELAHQWFGNLVTMNWWNDIWLNEGFATYMQHYGSDKVVGGEFRMDEQIIVNTVHVAMEADQLSSSHPLDVLVQTPKDIFQIFDLISYDKGSAIIRMLQNVVGEDVFQRALRQYLKDFSFMNANHYDLWDSISKVVHLEKSVIDWNMKPLNVTEWMLSWTEQMGFPLITVERNYSNNAATLNQSRFKLDENMPDDSKYANNSLGYQWYVPVWYKQGPIAQVQKTWLVPGQTLILPNTVDPKEWILINYGVPGFFRTNYDLKNWDLLKNQLINDNEAIDPKNKAQLIEDAFILAKVGKLPYSVALNLIEYMNGEQSYIVWSTCLSNFKFIKERLSAKEQVALINAYLRNLVRPIFNKLGNEVLNGPPEGLVTQLSPNLRRIIYCVGVAEDPTVDGYNFLWRKLLMEDISVEKLSITYGLSCTRNASLLTRLLQNAVDGEGIRTADVGGAFNMVSQNPIGSKMLWKYVSDNWQTIFAKFDSSHALSIIVKSATTDFSTKEQLAELNYFMKKHGDLGTAKTAFEQRLEETKFNIAWMQNYSNDVLDWFSKRLSRIV